MAYPPPPGTSSLPARPPVSAAAAPARSGFKPAFNSISQSAAPPAPSYASVPPLRATGPTYPGAPPSTAAQYASSSYSSYGGGGGSSRAPAGPLSHHQHHSTPPSYQYPQQRQGYGAQQHQHQHQHQYQHQHHNQHSQHNQYPQHGQHQHHQHQHQAHQHAHQSYGQQAAAQYSAAPQIRNPFPTPGPGGSDFDPEMAAQIAQWQSAYVPRETDKDGRPAAGAAEYPRPSDVPDPVAAAAAQPERKKTVVREGGGKKWRDDSLLEWDPSHLRLFVGNLAGETTDESLLKAFSRWRSVQKARVIRDKRTTKSKGFGFVSFSDADDFFQAAKEMNGKYIQSHPVVVKKATTEIKVTNAKDKDRNRHGRKGNGHGGGGQNHGSGNDKKKGYDQAGGGYEPYMGPMAGGGVTKPGQKTKNGLRLLG
ncbi:putative RNA-binding protein [Escovopsis weberi]|uniref:Putative RNA-binding protein n=1 Tax=Escovopsis weberi TaxID=150374 RepID=A0A0N0RTR3_ESCWE|nr:putative RNA-binding protein [Escovopsis weberi]